MTTPDTAPARSQKKKGGPRSKHVPQRTCVACRQKDAKRGYVRVVRTPEGRVEIDPTGKANGRGAYLCPRRGCWQRALEIGALGRALNVEIDPESKHTLAEYARSHFPPDEDSV
ncbi:hypothetical protein BH24CHL1_BH24CHL1_13160 [soil metagenome]